jgi:hypothetical protein
LPHRNTLEIRVQTNHGRVGQVTIEHAAHLHCRMETYADKRPAERRVDRLPRLNSHSALAEVIGNLDELEPSIPIEFLQLVKHAGAPELELVEVAHGLLRAWIPDERQPDLIPRQLRRGGCSKLLKDPAVLFDGHDRYISFFGKRIRRRGDIRAQARAGVEREDLPRDENYPVHGSGSVDK